MGQSGCLKPPASTRSAYRAPHITDRRHGKKQTCHDNSRPCGVTVLHRDGDDAAAHSQTP